MSKKYIIDEKLLLVLLEEHIELEALEYGGVNNWSYYGKSIEGYLKGGLTKTYNSITDVAYDRLNEFLSDKELLKESENE